MNVRAAVIVAAAGSGRRMGSVNKAFLDLDGQPVLVRSIRPFLDDARVCRVVVTLDAATSEAPPAWLTGLDPRVCTVAGGAERDDSVRRALAAVPADIDVIVVHDAARPLLTRPLVTRAIDEAAAGRAVTTAIPLADTIHHVDDDGRIIMTPDRTGLWRAQTPQAFPAAMLREAHAMAVRTDLRATDDASLVARVLGPVHVIEGSEANLKITVPADLLLARAILAAAGE
jgi:2-C-methyl-D-erythritol 4-phosphate cytidylyltransferase